LIINPRYNPDNPNSQAVITEDEKKSGDNAEEELKSLLARFKPNSTYIRELTASLNEVNPKGLSTKQIEDVQREHDFSNKSHAVRYIRTKNRE
tara:strand:- start:7543 stop:7821 length:279 start_codon:yes stop_codon:yes gene_type:complete